MYSYLFDMENNHQTFQFYLSFYVLNSSFYNDTFFVIIWVIMWVILWVILWVSKWVWWRNFKNLYACGQYHVQLPPLPSSVGTGFLPYFFINSQWNCWATISMLLSIEIRMHTYISYIHIQNCFTFRFNCNPSIYNKTTTISSSSL